jgi:hypothetical protein
MRRNDEPQLSSSMTRLLSSTFSEAKEEKKDIVAPESLEIITALSHHNLKLLNIPSVIV